ncbi:MAG TPA: hypothetical protein VIN08_23215 [Ohtaekwangia sp.]|uniref:hypothetical protein n=1 Tax=Ohtaekwangia sp. TaxID=2066019 RepID=UPI002F9518E1
MDSNYRMLLSKTFIAKQKADNEDVFDFYDIGNWVIDTVKKYDTIRVDDVVDSFEDFISYYKWIGIKRFAINIESEVWDMTRQKSLSEWLYELKLKYKGSYIESLAYDIAYVDCYYRSAIDGEEIDLSDYNCLNFCIQLYEDRHLSFNTDLKMDLFMSNPSRQQGVYLSSEEVKNNNKLLTDTLQSLENGGVFSIRSFESSFYPEAIYKYGFKDA